jgi:hypothetical protein
MMERNAPSPSDAGVWALIEFKGMTNGKENRQEEVL